MQKVGLFIIFVANQNGIGLKISYNQAMSRFRLQLSRLCIGLVLFFNVQCALAFLFQPEAYVGGFELSGAPGEGMVRGMGLLFLMWNVPYAVALWHPQRQRVSLYEAIVMQALGAVGETLLLTLTLPPGHELLRLTVQRFMLFDYGGLLLLLLALTLSGARGQPK